MRDENFRGTQVLVLLVLINVLNMLDRNLPFILAGAIKEDLQLSDSQIGLLGGLVFAVVYTLGGIPFGRMADRGKARPVIALAVSAWSAMTAIGGLAQNFWHLAIARLGVATGEAALAPAAHAIISRHFPEGRRATVIALFSIGIPIGYMLGLAMGGWLLEELGWRLTFLVVGVPGLLLGLAAWLVLPRGSAEQAQAADAVTMGEVMRHAFAKPAYRHTVVAASLYSFAGYTMVTFLPLFIMKSYGWGAMDTGLWLGLVTGASGLLGIPLSGWLADHLAKRDPRWRLWLSAILMGLSAPFVALAMLAPTAPIALAMLFVPLMLTVAYVGPTFSAVHAMMPEHMRALAISLLIGALTLIGASAGPPLVGLVSDLLAARYGDGSLAMSILVLAPATLLLSAWQFMVAARRLPGDLHQST